MKNNVALLFLLLAVAVPIAAQTPAPPEGPTPEQVLKDSLGLSDQQLASFRDLARIRASAAETLARQLEERQRALDEALSATSPDPGNVGALVVSISSLQRQSGQIEAAFQSGLLRLLTDEQRSKLAFIRSVEAALKAAAGLHRLGV